VVGVNNSSERSRILPGSLKAAGLTGGGETVWGVVRVNNSTKRSRILPGSLRLRAFEARCEVYR
jgi:hypothetical protein